MALNVLKWMAVAVALLVLGPLVVYLRRFNADENPSSGDDYESAGGAGKRQAP